MSATTGRTLNVQPTKTTTYVVSYENICPISDTVIVEVHNLSVTADWSDFTTAKCEGSQTSATLTVTGYDATMSGSYIYWYKDGVQLSSYNGLTTLDIAETKVSDMGKYSYEVSNGICVLPNALTPDVQELVVMPYATFTAEQKEYIVIRGENQDLLSA